MVRFETNEFNTGSQVFCLNKNRTILLNDIYQTKNWLLVSYKINLAKKSYLFVYRQRYTRLSIENISHTEQIWMLIDLKAPDVKRVSMFDTKIDYWCLGFYSNEL